MKIDLKTLLDGEIMITRKLKAAVLASVLAFGAYAPAKAGGISGWTALSLLIGAEVVRYFSRVEKNEMANADFPNYIDVEKEPAQRPFHSISKVNSIVKESCPALQNRKFDFVINQQAEQQPNEFPRDEYDQVHLPVSLTGRFVRRDVGYNIAWQFAHKNDDCTYFKPLTLRKTSDEIQPRGWPVASAIALAGLIGATINQLRS